MTKKRMITISDPLDAWLRELAEEDGISVSEVIRRILDVERKKPQTKGKTS